MMDFDNVYGYYENFGTNDDALDRYDVRMRLPRKRKLPSTMAGNGRTANKKRKISFEPTPATVAKLDEKKIFTPGVNLSYPKAVWDVMLKADHTIKFDRL